MIDAPLPRQPFILLDSADHDTGRLYSDLQKIDVFTAADIDQLDAALTAGWQQGWHNCLLMPYDFGRDLMGIAQTDVPLSLYWFARYEQLDQVTQWLQDADRYDAPAGIISPTLIHDRARFTQAIHEIHECIRAGETYQVNFTSRCDFAYYGHPMTLYRQLRQVQPAPYAALMYHGDESWTLSLSPECFFSLEDDHIIAEPMKGTAPIRHDGQDAQRQIELSNDPKNRAENAMIVDLLRNDLGKIAQMGSVCVQHPFRVKAHGRVWQMTSEVHADLPPSCTYSDLIRALFPCGSITGAPKHRTMHIIDTLESAPRGNYTGALGFIEANGRSVFNILIRTLFLNAATGHMGVGSGITIDSSADGEYDECHWKTAFLQHFPQPYALFETMALRDGTIALCDAHLTRLSHSAAALGFSCNVEEIAAAIKQYSQSYAEGFYRLKLSLDYSGNYRIEAFPCSELAVGQSVIIYPQRIRAGALSRFKTTARKIYDSAWQTADTYHAFDALLFNEQGYLLEGGRCNVFVLLEDGWHTPRLDLNILPGIMRQTVLANPEYYLGNSRVQESLITQAQLISAQKIIVSNALRGAFPVTLQ